MHLKNKTNSNLWSWPFEIILSNGKNKGAFHQQIY